MLSPIIFIKCFFSELDYTCSLIEVNSIDLYSVKMETLFPDDKELKFREENFGAIENILNDKVECTICKNDLMNEIVSKKMIMVHRIHLVLCCYNCFYKLFEGNEFSCILCESNKELSNCEKCNFNICKRCIEIHEIHKVSNGVISKCFGCQPRILWKQRAQTSNVLKIFSSQLDMPNGLLVNDIERQETVRKYLLKEAKNGRNSKGDNIKDQLCLNFIFESFKSSIIERISNCSPNNDSSVSINDHVNGLIQNCEKVLEKTCSTLTNVKKVFNLNTQLNPSISAMMKSLLKSFDEDENVSCHSRISEKSNSIKDVKKSKANQSSDISNTRNLRSERKLNLKDESIKSPSSSSSVNVPPPTNLLNRDLAIVIERLDDSILFKKMGIKSSNVNSKIKIDEVVHPLDLFRENSSSNSSEEENTRKLRSRKVIKIDEKKQKTQSKNNKIVKSDDEKENDRLIKLSNIEKQSKKKIIDENCSSSDDNTDTSTKIVNEYINRPKSPELSKNEVIEKMKEAVQNIDETDSDTDDNLQNEESSLISVKDIFSEVRNAVGIPQINNETCTNDESDDSSINDVINTCLTTCKRPGIEHYLKKNQENQLDVNDLESINVPDELENENTDSSNSSKSTKRVITRSKRLSPLNIPSTSNESESDLKPVKAENGFKRKLSTTSSSNNSDSSSKYFKNTPKKKKKTSSGKSSIFDSIYTSNSSNTSSDEDSLPVPVKKRGRIKIIPLNESGEDSKNSSSESNKSNINSPSKKGRKNIRRLKKKTELSQLTLDALEEEASRKMRIEKRQQLYNQIYDLPQPLESCKKLVLDFDPETKKDIVVVHPDLVKFLKPHQVQGVKFLWNSVFESLAQVKNHKGNGSIIAHCMGLGKTLQIITLIHTLFRYPEMGIKTILVITPHSTIENWCSEFHKWLNDIPEESNFFIFNFTEAKTYGSRKKVIEDWQKMHGVLITSYQMYRTVVNFKSIKKYPVILEGLVDPGPDVVICDEGHLLKNQSSATSKTINRMKTLRRIVLTGTPLQNNLKEYHCMVDFIRPNLLGSIRDFTNRFINPITNGQYSDSTPLDVKLMKKRSHVLHRMLEGFVQRFDYSVLTPFLPPKHEYVIYLKLSDKQIELYQHYLNNHRQQGLFANYHMLQMVWTHPKLLQFYCERIETRKEKQKLKDLDANFTNDETSSDDSKSTEEADNDHVPLAVMESIKTAGSEIDINWWKPLVSMKDLETVYPYSKFLMMFSILKECEEIGDKVLIFSQSLFTLDIIQEFLENAEDLDDKGGPYGNSWISGQDFFRIDGSTPSKERETCCNRFNDVDNFKMRLLLLSTKAFNLGINLVGANRVVIFDVTWNPSLNVQSIFRVFRFGQTKPCYIYRFISEGTMEQKIYERQISKLSLAFRVIDEHQIDRHFNAKDQEVLYEFEPNTTPPKSTLNLPKDRLMADLILKHKDLVIDILEHDSLLQNNEAEELDEDDRNSAWDDYQKEKKEGFIRTQQGFNNIQMNNSHQQNILNNINQFSTSSFQPSDGDEVLFNTLRTLFPHANLIQLNEMLIQVKNKERGVEQ